MSQDGAYSEILERSMIGYESSNRTSVDTISNPFQSSRYDLTGCAIPLLTQKRIFLKPLLVELEWYLKGTGDIAFLRENGVTIWDQWADEEGQLGEVYGVQWRRWKDTRYVTKDQADLFTHRGFKIIDTVSNMAVVHREIDQLQNMVDLLRNTPDSRRILLSAWNAAAIDDMRLPPCHMVWQLCSKVLPDEIRASICYDRGVAEREYGIVSKFVGFADYMDVHSFDPADVNPEMMDQLELPTRGIFGGTYQRSVDVPVGLPFNIAGYSILTHFLAEITGHIAVDYSHFGGDVHVYVDQLDGVEEYLSREAIDCIPRVFFPSEWKELDDFKWDGVRIEGYKHHPAIKFPVTA